MSAAHRALVLAGGLTFERDVSLRSGRRVTDALRAEGVETAIADADAELLPTISAFNPDAVFIALHGGAGESGAVRAVLDLAGVRYVGARPHACRLAYDKPTAKAIVEQAGLRTPDWVALPHVTFRELGAARVLDALIERLGVPVMVKPAQGGSALGATIVHRAADLAAAMVHCFSYGSTALVEQFVTGTEVAVSVIEDTAGAVALPAVEVVPKNALFDYAARYTAGMTDYYTPARLDDQVAAAAAEAALIAHRSLCLRDLSRSDLIIDATGTPWFLEVNVSPGMTETSLLPMSVAAAGRDLGQVCASLVQQAAHRDD
jgi:D-alanine-D-alanine ligase